jgi:hypothetical protein
MAAPDAAQITRWRRRRHFEDAQSARVPAAAQPAPGRRRHPPAIARLALAAGAALVIGLVVIVLNLTQGQDDAEDDPGPDTPLAAVSGDSTEGDASQGLYVREARLLAEALAEFSTRAVTLLDHEPVVDGSSGLDEAAEALARIGERNGVATPDLQRLALVADTVCSRWSELRPVALSERTADEGVLALHALGREVGSRAAELASILDSLSGAARSNAIDEVLTRPWPPAGEEGLDTPA